MPYRCALERGQIDAARADIACVGGEDERAVRAVAHFGVPFRMADAVALNTTLSAL